MKKILSVLLILVILNPCVVRADQPKKYWGQVVTTNITVGQTISFEIGPNSETESISDFASGSTYYSADILKDIIAHEINGTVIYDSNVLEYVDITVSQKGGCCYESPTPKTNFKTGNIEINWDSESGSDWGYHDTILVNFNVKSAPTNNQTEIKFVPTQGGETNQVSKIITINKNNLNTENDNLDREDEELEKEDDNENVENKDNDSIYKDPLVIILIGTNLILMITIIALLISNNKKK